MLIVNQAMKNNKSKGIDGSLALQSPRGGDKKSAKFNFGGFLKKIPLPVNKRAADEEKSDSVGGMDTPEMSLSPTAQPPNGQGLNGYISPKNAKARTKSNGDIATGGRDEVTIQTLGGDNYTHEVIPMGESSNLQRYATFTSKCISLENSEVTSQLDLDEQSMEVLLYSPTYANGEWLASSLKLPPKASTTKSRINNNNTVTSIVEDSSSRGEAYQSYIHFNNFDAYRCETDETDETDDIVEYLSETESDLNINPHHEENINDYKVGGYHPVSKGEVYYSRDFPKREYVVLRKLGWGHFSTVWLAKSRFNPDLNPSIETDSSEDSEDSYVAIKFVKSSENYIEAAEDEIKLLKTLDKPLVNGDHLQQESKNYFKNYEINDDNQPIGHPGYQHVMRLLDDFEVNGPNGKHICMVFEVLGENVLNLISKSKSISKSLKQTPKGSNEKKDTKVENNKNFKLFKSKLSLGLINNPKRDLVEPDTNENNSYIKNYSSDSLSGLIETQKTYGGIPLTLVKLIVKQLFLAVDYMHHCGIIHTDIKPENILIEIKEINSIIKDIENEKINRFNSKHKNRKDSSISTINMNDMKLPANRKNSLSIQTRQESVGYGTYRKSRNSIGGKCDSPVRSSKPLSTCIYNNSMFKESFCNNGNHYSRKKSIAKINECGTSPTNMTVLKQTNDSKNNNDRNNRNDLISIKIADLGNATFTHHHFTNQIQTRQYRAPEILLKHKSWGASADIWSIGCVIFELITGDYLFDPHSGNNFDKDEDHMAQIIELLCEFPSSAYLKNCDLTSVFFNKESNLKYSLKNINKLKYWSLHDVLVQKYKFDENDLNVNLICDLISKCLIYNLDDRYDCKSLINHPWLNNDMDFTNFDFESLKDLPKNHDDIPGFTS